MKTRSRRGSLAVFFCLVLAAAMMFLMILLRAAQTRSLENDLSRAMSAQIQCRLAAYDCSWREFGLFGFRPGQQDSSVFRAMLPAQMQSCQPRLVFEKPLSDLKILDGQIIRYMKARVPALYLARIGAAFSASSVRISSGLAPSASLDFAGISEKEVRTAANGLFGSLLEKLQDQALLLIRDNYRRYASEILGCPADNPISDILGGMPDFFNPGSMTGLSESIERLLDFNTSPVYEKCCLVEYVLGQFRPDVQKISDAAGSRLLGTLDGRSFSSFPASREAEAEQILTGLDKPDSARLAIKAMITCLRSVIHLAAILGDSKRMETIRASATGISVFIAVLTGGQIMIEPQVMAYLMAAGQAISAGFSDYARLAEGWGVRIWPGQGQFDLPAYYQDYLRIFLLFVPREIVLSRVSSRLQTLLPGPCYTSLQISASFRNRTYRLAGGYR